MAKISAGLLMVRRRAAAIEVLLVHPGGPFFKNKDAGAWTIPKGELNENESELECACREFEEETGIAAAGPFCPLATIKQKGGKLVHAWWFEGDIDPASIRSNTFEMQWPPKSGKMQQFAEIDRAAFFDLATARLKINRAQAPWLDELLSGKAK